MVRLRKQARHCNSGAALVKNLSDHLIEKLPDVELKKKLLEVNNITLGAAMDKVRKWEASREQVSQMPVTPSQDRQEPGASVGAGTNAVEQRSGRGSKDQSPEDDGYIRMVALYAVSAALLIEEIERIVAQNPELQSVIICLIEEKWDIVLKSYLPVRNELTFIGHAILLGTRIVVPQALCKRVVSLAHEGHEGVVKTSNSITSANCASCTTEHQSEL
ncbi:hypothetical protein ACROYT_G021101 [Oculina patagonica]